MSILSLLLFILLISSGSIFCSSYFNRKFEEVLPITCIGIVLISFLLGLVGLLKISTLVICVIATILLIIGIYKSIRSKAIKNLLLNTFTPGFVIFIVLIIVMFLGVYNKVFDSCDEFSHWGDIVKVMTILKDFGTNPNSYSLFKSYPPGMALFQFTLEEINIFVTKEAFSEWLCYMAYDIFCVALLLPICKNMTFKKILSPITVLLVIFLVPFSFYAYSYFSVYIDEFLAFLIAAGAINLLWHDKCDVFFDITMSSIIFMLVLSKDAGLLFGIFFAAAYIIEHLLEKNRQIVSIVMGVLSVAIPKLLWTINIKINNAASSFSNKVDILSLINVLLGREDSYRGKVLKNYITRFVVGTYQPGNSGILINYISLTAISIFVVYIVTRLVKKNTNYSKVTFISLFIETIVYFIGLCVIYMYKFSEIEALGLASLQRYVHIMFLGLWLFIGLSFVKYLDYLDDKRKIVSGLIICLVLYISNLEAVVTFVSNAYAKASLAFRSEYSEIVNKTLNYADDNSKIWFIHQGGSGEERLQYKFCVRPNIVDGDYSLEANLDEDDIISTEISADEWKNELIEGQYDYVLLYKLDDSFLRDYSELFEDANDIREMSLYKVDSNKGLLSLCE